MLKMMVGSNLKDQQLQQIVDKTIMEADLDGDGKINFEEFAKMVANTDVSMSMTLGMWRVMVRVIACRFANSYRSFLIKPRCFHYTVHANLSFPLHEPTVNHRDQSYSSKSCLGQPMIAASLNERWLRYQACSDFNLLPLVLVHITIPKSVLCRTSHLFNVSLP